MNALRQSAVDPDTGYVDVGILATGVTDSSRKAAAAVSEKIERLFAEKNTAQFVASRLFRELRNEDKTIDQHVFHEAIQLLTKAEKVSKTGDKIKLIV